jgi:hypothetical protein
VTRLARVGGGAIAATLGIIGGLVTAYLLRPSDAEIREAVRSLVPSGMAVTHEGHGKRGSSIGPSFDPYIAVLQTSGGPADPEERVALFRRQAERRGWRQVSDERSPNAVDLLYLRKGIRGGVGVILDEPVAYLAAKRDRDATNRRRVVGVVGGAVGGLAVWGVSGLVRRTE